MTLNKSQSRADQLQFLRFLAFCLIFIHHIEWPLLGFPTGYGSGMAVSFFFILGGFVSAYSRYGKQEKLRWYSPATYLWGKYKKVLPLHLLTLGIALLLSNIPAAFTAQNQPWLEPQLISLRRNFLLIHAWYKDSYFDFNGVSWFLSSIMFSYLLTLPVSALLCKISQNKGHIPVLFLILAVLCGAVFGWCYYSRDMDRAFVQYIHPAARALEYLAGMVLCHLVLSFKARISPGRISAVIFTVLEVLALVFWFAFFYIPHKAEWSFLTARWLLPNLILLTIFGFGFGYISAAFRWNPLKRLGDVSFECFLIHQLVIRIYLLFNAQIVTPGIRELALRAIVCFIITVGAALYLNKKPAVKK